MLLLFYLLIINAWTFLLMLIDKQKAKRNRWRIPEKVLLGFSAAGGSLGGYLSMKLLRHKTKHPKFSVGLPIMLVIHAVVFGILIIL